jgi:hypothetical protein
MVEVFRFLEMGKERNFILINQFLSMDSLNLIYKQKDLKEISKVYKTKIEYFSKIYLINISKKLRLVMKYRAGGLKFLLEVIQLNINNRETYKIICFIFKKTLDSTIFS